MDKDTKNKKQTIKKTEGKWLKEITNKNISSPILGYKEIIKRWRTYQKNASRKIHQNEIIIKDSNFSCTRCGKCCDVHKSKIGTNVTALDINNWINEDLGFILVSLGAILTTKNEPLLSIDRKEDFLFKDVYHSLTYNNIMKNTNPSLLIIDEEDKGQCVFYDSIDEICSIYHNRPSSCRMFPYSCDVDIKNKKIYIAPGNISKEICEKSAFSKINVSMRDIEKIKENCINVLSDIDGNVLLTKSKLNSNVKELILMFQYLIRIFYYMYNEYTNIEKLEKVYKK